MTTQEVLQYFQKVKQTGNNQYSALCPAHDDHTASLCIGTGDDGKTLITCQRGCNLDDILSAVGLKRRDLFATPLETKQNKAWEYICSYYYPDKNGRPRNRKDRYIKPDGKKTFVWKHYDGKQWVKHKTNGDPGLYNADCISSNDLIYIVEGEKDVETLRACGRAAVCSPHGAKQNGESWKPEYTEALKGKSVVVIQDNDETGKVFSSIICNALTGQAASVKLVDLCKLYPDLKEHGDITDLCELNGDNNAIIQAIETMAAGLSEYQKQEPPEETLDPFLACFKQLDEFIEEEAKWLIPGWIPEGQIALMAADGGTGKTSNWCEIIAALSSGRRCFLDPPDYQREPLRVAFLTTEDSVRKKLRRKLREAGANLKNIITPDFLADKEGLLRNLKFASGELERFIRYFKPSLCIFDPVQGFIPPDINMGSRNAMRDCMAPLITIGEECGTSFLIVCHTNKRKGEAGRYRIADSADLWDVARSVMMIGYTEEQGIRYLSNEKNNYTNLQETILFTINDSGRIEVTGTSWKRDREYMQDYSIAQSPSKRQDCKEFILHALGEAGGKMPIKDLEDQAKENGYSERTLKRAKDEMKNNKEIKYYATGFGKEKTWYIELLTTAILPESEELIS